MTLEFKGVIWFWKGPAPFYFVTMPAKESRDLHEVSALLTYGWGCIPAGARIGSTQWKTALIPKDGRYLVPIKASVRQAESLEEGNAVTIRLTFELPSLG